MFIIIMFNLLFSFCLLSNAVVFVNMQPLQMAKSQPVILRSTLRLDNNTDAQRFQTFVYRQNKNNIDQANSEPNKTYTLQANAFAKLTENQIKQRYLSLIPSTPTSIKFAKSLVAQKKVAKLQAAPTDNAPSPKSDTNQSKTSNLNAKIIPHNAGATATVTAASTATAAVTSRVAVSPTATMGIDTSVTTAATAMPTATLRLNIQGIASQSEATDRTLIQTQHSDLSSIQNEVLGQVKQFLSKKNVPKHVIQNEILPQHKYQGPLVFNTTSGRRLLQSILLNDNAPLATSNTQNTTLMQDLKASSIPLNKLDQNSTDKTAIVKDVDWSCLSGRVKAQGDCGACYAFATADNVGALLGIYYYTFFIQLSIQEIIDCTQNSLVYGCNGGFLEGALAKMVDPGTLTQYTYPYNSLDLSKTIDRTCKTANSKMPRFTIDSFDVLPKGDCNAIKIHLQKSPISVGISGYKLAFYGKGVFDGCDESDDLDHAVLLVGYKQGKGWKIKNSWGPRWGEGGFAWLKEGNTCRICQIAFYPIPSFRKGYELYRNNRFEKTCPPP